MREIQEFLTPEECDHIIERARPVMEESMVISRRRGNEKKKSFVRTSESGYLSHDRKGPNRLAVHEAKIVHSGEKWILNQWIREHRYKSGGRKPVKTGSRQRFSRKRR